MKVLFPWVVLLILALTAVACATAAPTPTPIPTATPRPTAQSDITLPPTPTPWGTLMPAFTPRPTATPSPTATPAPPTPTPATLRPTPTLAETSTCFRFADGANLFQEHDAIRWSECPVIENGILRAAGTVLGGRTLLNSPSVATFVIKYRHTDRDALTILRPAPPGASYPNTPGTAAATLWDVSSRSFSIKAPVGNLAEPVDLLVWGSDIPGAHIKALPLAIHSIRYIR